MRVLNMILGPTLSLVGFTWSLPAQATVTPYGVSCGPVLAGEINAHHSPAALTLRLEGGAPHGDALMVFGVGPLVTPLPASNCLLLTEAYHLEHFMLNDAGRALWRFRLPVGFTGEARLQVIEVLFDPSNNFSFISSNGLHVVVPPV
jgi:hypothetical protein